MKLIAIPHPKTVSFIVLALNEEAFIETTVRMVIEAVKASRVEHYEIVMIDDGSTDRTGAIMDSLALRLHNIMVLHNRVNQGLGAAFIRGVGVATYEYVMIIAGDNIMPRKSITKIVNELGLTDMVLPYMTDDKYRETIRRYGSSGFTRLINLMSGHNIRYYNGMVVRRVLFAGEQIQSTGYSLMAECVIKFLAKGATYSEIGVPHEYPLLLRSNSKALRINNLMNLAGSLIRLHRAICQSRRS